MEKTWQEIVVILVLLAFFVVGVFAVFGLRQGLSKPPALNVSLDTTTYTNQDKITINGKTDPGATVKANGQDVNVDSGGNFSVQEPLNNGDNKVSFVATKGGKEASAEKTIVRQSSEQSVAGAQTQPGTSSNLSTSGPADSLFGLIGLAAIIAASYFYLESKKSGKYQKFQI